jgi:hypothetical protein
VGSTRRTRRWRLPLPGGNPLPSPRVTQCHSGDEVLLLLRELGEWRGLDAKVPDMARPGAEGLEEVRPVAGRHALPAPVRDITVIIVTTSPSVAPLPLPVSWSCHHQMSYTSAPSSTTSSYGIHTLGTIHKGRHLPYLLIGLPPFVEHARVGPFLGHHAHVRSVTEARLGPGQAGGHALQMKQEQYCQQWRRMHSRRRGEACKGQALSAVGDETDDVDGGMEGGEGSCVVYGDEG